VCGVCVCLFVCGVCLFVCVVCVFVCVVRVCLCVCLVVCVCGGDILTLFPLYPEEKNPTQCGSFTGSFW